jgi:hypothetical protein
MRGQILKGIPEKIGISALNYYNAEFTVDVLNEETQTFIVQNQEMTESVEPVQPFSNTLSEDRLKDSTTIKLTSVVGLNVTDRLLISGEIYRVVSLDEANKTVKLHTTLKDDVYVDTNVSRVGNLGVYYINLLVSTPGTFVIRAKCKKFGLMVSDLLVVQEKSIEEMLNKIDIQVKENEEYIIESSKGWVIII